MKLARETDRDGQVGSWSGGEVQRSCIYSIYYFLDSVYFIDFSFAQFAFFTYHSLAFCSPLELSYPGQKVPCWWAVIIQGHIAGSLQSSQAEIIMYVVFSSSLEANSMTEAYQGMAESSDKNRALNRMGSSYIVSSGVLTYYMCILSSFRWGHAEGCITRALMPIK